MILIPNAAFSDYLQHCSRKTTKAEKALQEIYSALGISTAPGGIK